MFCNSNCQVLFYCHFPDQLLVRRTSFLKKLYRVPFDAIEEYTTGSSDQIVVNSNFTKQIFHDTFKKLNHIDPQVVYPCVDTETIVDTNTSSNSEVSKFFKDSPFFFIN